VILRAFGKPVGSEQVSSSSSKNMGKLWSRGFNARATVFVELYDTNNQLPRTIHVADKKVLAGGPHKSLTEEQ
jgi:hypothetical protein